MKVVVFDLGGTLMQYVGMPHSWEDFYYKGFEEIIRKFRYSISQDAVEKSFQMLKEFNPRIHYREVEYSAEYIFTKILEPWHMDIPIQSCIETFWSGLRLKAEIYPETINVLQKLKEKGYTIAVLTDLPRVMPDEIFRRDISELLGYFDYYVSSTVAGYRKPNCKGLQMISERFSSPITELIFIGDEEKDRRTAMNANCKFIQFVLNLSSSCYLGFPLHLTCRQISILCSLQRLTNENIYALSVNIKLVNSIHFF